MRQRKRTLLTLLLALSAPCFLRASAPSPNRLDLDQVQMRIVNQAQNILDAFEMHALNVDGEPFQTLLAEEFDVTDDIEISLRAADIAKTSKPGAAAETSENLEVITEELAVLCAASQRRFDAAMRSTTLPQLVLQELDIQNTNLRIACKQL